MAEAANLLTQYQALVNSHTAQFDPEIMRLQEVVTQHLQNWQHHEQSLVEAQAIALETIRGAIASDARWLLHLSEFQQYIQDAKPTPKAWYSSTPESKVDENPLLWQIAISPHPVQITNYREAEDHDAYDDERTHLAYTYQVSVHWGTYNADLNEIITERIYGVRERHPYSLEDQRDVIEAYLGDLFYGEELAETEKALFGEELSYLVGYACVLLALKPRTVQFTYPIRHEEAA